MSNAQPIEIVWTVWALIGWLLSFRVLYIAALAMGARYVDKRNGSVKLLTWQFFIVSVFCLIGLTAALVVGIIAMALPTRLDNLDSPTEYAIAQFSMWASPLALFLIVSAFIGISSTKLYIGRKLERYYAADRKYNESQHPHRRHDDPPVEPNTH